MTVKQLIEQLQKMPQDMIVFNNGSSYAIDHIQIIDDYYVPDEDKPIKCVVLVSSIVKNWAYDVH